MFASLGVCVRGSNEGSWVSGTQGSYGSWKTWKVMEI